MKTSCIQICAIFLFLAFASTVIGQDDAKKMLALEKGRAALELMDNGKVDESIKLLKEAQKLDPTRFDYPYELAYAYYLKKNYKETIKILEKIKDHKDRIDRYFQLLGNGYDMSGNPKKALQVYDEGLKAFPNSGIMYLEKGNVYLMQKEYNKALGFYEKGIEADPAFPSNYYRAALLYCNSNEAVWGIIYGEIFMNLERNSARTIEISELLYNTYKNEIKFKNDTTISVSFCQMMTMDLKSMKTPFCMIYEPTMLIALSLEKGIDINSLARIRANFLKYYYSMGRDKTHPNYLFDYQQKIEAAGHLEAYNHWVLMKGAEADFNAWYLENKEKFDQFAEWFLDNQLELDAEHHFYRGQY